MKKILTGVLVMMLIMSCLAGCGAAQKSDSGNTFKLEYGSSEIYDKADMDAAVEAIVKEFNTWEGCELHSVRYAGDECVTEENIKWMNDLGDGKNYTEVIEFLSDFHSPVEGGGAWAPDEEYTDWNWWLARTEGGDWDLLTWGY